MVQQATLVSAFVTFNTAIIIMAWSMLMKKNEMPVKGRTVLITGASQGMGLSAARMLSAKGANVIIVARNKEKLESALKEITAAALHSATQRFHAISLDLSTPDANNTLLTQAAQWNNDSPPDIIWAVAGVSYPRLFLDSTPEEMHYQMNVNYWSCVYLAQASLRAWLASPHPPTAKKDGTPVSPNGKSRHFITTSSIAAYVPCAGYAPYAPAKAALRNLHDMLTQELNLYNGAFTKQDPSPPQIKTHIVFPGSITSPGMEVENQSKHQVTKMLEEDDSVQSPDQAAEAAIKELEAGRAFITTQGWFGEVLKACALQGTPRDQPVLNTLLGWIVSLVWLFVSWDMANKVWKMGVKEGLPKHASAKGK